MSCTGETCAGNRREQQSLATTGHLEQKEPEACIPWRRKQRSWREKTVVSEDGLMTFAEEEPAKANQTQQCRRPDLQLPWCIELKSPS